MIIIYESNRMRNKSEIMSLATILCINFISQTEEEAQWSKRRQNGYEI